MRLRHTSLYFDIILTMKKAVLKLIAMLVGVSLIEITCWGANSVTLQDMLGAHMDRVMRKSGLLFPTRYGEPFTNWFGRVVMEGEDALPFGYNYIQLRDSDGWAEVRDETGALTCEIEPLHDDAAFVLGDLFGFVPSEDTPPELRLSHLVSKWLVCHSEEEADAIDLTEDELHELASACARRVPRLASAPLVVTNLMVTAIKAESDRVTFVTEWPSSMTFPNDRLDLYTSVDLRGAWSFHGSYDVAGVNAITTTVMKASIAGYLESQRAQHDDDCYVITNIVASAFEPNVTYTNRQWNCEHKARSETPGFFRWADQSDSDGNGISDAAEEWVYRINTTDTDGDGMPDWWEIASGFDPNVFGEELDSDRDGLPDRQEVSMGTNPNNPDSDSDGVDDGDEYYAGTNPLNSDTDGDGITDGEEHILGTDPLMAESYWAESVAAEESNYSRATIQPFQLFEGTQENTNKLGPNYEMLDQYHINVNYSGATTSGFNICGIYPNGGSCYFNHPVSDSFYDEWGPYNYNAFNLFASGARFKALKTGRYSFQAAVDDTVEAHIGSGNDVAVVAADFYGTNPSEVAHAVFIENQICPVSIRATSVGGPAYLRFPVWGAFEPILKPQLSVKSSSKVLIFENEYQNFPHGATTPKRSTRTTIGVGIRAGGLGGRLCVRTEGRDKLCYKDGDDCLLLDVDVPADSTNTWYAVYEGAVESQEEDDVRVIATFTENRTGEVVTSTDTLTVVRIELTPKNTAPQSASNNRHCYGVCEDVDLRHYPRTVDVNWDFSEGLVMDDGHGLRFYRNPFSLGGANCSFKWGNAHVSCNGEVFDLDYIVFAPSIVARNPRTNVNSRDVDPKIFEAGHLLLYIEMYASPFFVSFKDVQIRETPDESQGGTHAGYFDDREKGGSWSHSAANGAGGWNIVGDTGYYADDKAGVSKALAKPWMDGYKIWNIPMEWGFGNRSYGVIMHGSSNPTDQVFTLYGSGTFSIRKFQYEAKRNIFGITTINGK